MSEALSHSQPPQEFIAPTPEGIPADPLTAESMQDDVALAEIYVIGNLALRDVVDSDTHSWTHRAGSLLAASGALTLDGNIKPELADRLLARWRGEPNTPREEAVPQNLSIPFSSPEAAQTSPPANQYAAKLKQSSIPFSNNFGNYHNANQSPSQPTPPIPEATFSTPEQPQPSKPHQPYTPTFDVKFKEATFSPEATLEAQHLLAEVANEKNIKPEDALGRVDIAREAFKRAHPDRGGNTETAQILNAVYRGESKSPRAQAAKAAQREARRQETNAQPTEPITPTMAPETPASPPSATTSSAPEAAAPPPAATPDQSVNTTPPPTAKE